MKKVRSLTILVGLSLVMAGVGVTGAKAQVLSSPKFTGSFALHTQVQWGPMTLPAGSYVVKYGRMGPAGLRIVEIAGKAKGSPHGFVLVRSEDPTRSEGDMVICARADNMLIVRALDMPAIGKSASFVTPQDARLMANATSRNGNTRMADASLKIARIPVSRYGN